MSSLRDPHCLAVPFFLDFLRPKRLSARLHMKVLVTGAAGFIGHHVCERLVRNGRAEVLGVDNLNDYYSVDLKRARLARLADNEKFRFIQSDFADAKSFAAIWNHFKPDYVAHLGAQAGVRHSIENPAAYIHSNLNGFGSLLEAARALPPRHIIFASSSSVYGDTATVPFREDASLGRPLSFYAATKQANESMAFAYARHYNLPISGLRLFTAYGPWGRPDMTPLLFTEAIVSGKPIRLYNRGLYRRDFTYIDDIVDGILRCLLYPPATPSVPPFRIFNLGHHAPVEMIHFVSLLEKAIGKKALVEMLPPQPSEMPETCADISSAHAAFAYTPRVSLEEGISRLVAWHRDWSKA